MLAVEFTKTNRELQELQGRKMPTGVETTTFGKRVYKLMLEIILQADAKQSGTCDQA